MLSFSKTDRATQLALSENVNVFRIKDQEYPLQKIKTDPVDLLNPEEILKIFKKYKLPKADQDKLLNFYGDSESETIQLEGDWKLQRALTEFENKIIHELKTVYYSSQDKLQPYFDGRLALGLLGASNSGKTWMASSILSRDEFKNWLFKRIKP